MTVAEARVRALMMPSAMPRDNGSRKRRIHGPPPELIGGTRQRARGIRSMILLPTTISSKLCNAAPDFSMAAMSAGMSMLSPSMVTSVPTVSMSISVTVMLTASTPGTLDCLVHVELETAHVHQSTSLPAVG